MTLHIIYRSYGGENQKGRPSYYSKLLALGSFIRSVRQLDPRKSEIIFLNDGPIPADRLRLMQSSGEIVQRANLGNRGSIRAALSLVQRRSWDRDDLVWLSEDDYLYRPECLRAIVDAARNLESVDYFSVYALFGNRMPNGERPEDRRVPAEWHGTEFSDIDGRKWRSALSTTSTFGARVSALLADRHMMFAAMWCGGAFDHSKCLVFQGYTPYPPWFLAEQIKGASGVRSMLRALLVASVRMAFNGYTFVRRPMVARRTLVGSDPALATHMESRFLATGTDWISLAADTSQWIRDTFEHGE